MFIYILLDMLAFVSSASFWPNGGKWRTLKEEEVTKEILSSAARYGEPLVIRSSEFDENEQLRIWNRSRLVQRFGELPITVSKSRKPVFERVEPVTEWPESLQFWRDWLGIKSRTKPLPVEIHSRADTPGRFDPTACPTGCVRFNLDKVVVRPRTEKTTMGAALHSIPGDFYHYLQYAELPAPLVDELAWWKPSYGDDLVEDFRGIWMGFTNTSAQLHYDANENLFVQITGVREWTLFHRDTLSEILRDGFMVEVEEVDEKSMDDERKANINLSFFTSPLTVQELEQRSDLNALHITLHPGDQLFLPAYTWHMVQSKPDTKNGLSVGANRWYAPVWQRSIPRPSNDLDAQLQPNVQTYGEDNALFQATCPVDVINV